MNLFFLIPLWFFLVWLGVFFIKKTQKPLVFKLDRTIFLGILAGILLGLVSLLLFQFFADFREELFTLLVPAGRKPSFAWLLIVNPLATAIVQEIWFRGFFQQHLGIFWTSLFFGLLHFFPFVGFLFPVLAFLGGLLLGYLFLRTKNLLVPILAHAIIIFFFSLGVYLV